MRNLEYKFITASGFWNNHIYVCNIYKYIHVYVYIIYIQKKD